MITTELDGFVGKIHLQIPVILDKDKEDDWLNPDIIEPEQLLPMLKPYPAELMEERRVRDAAKNWRNDSPDLMKPVE